MKKIHAGRVEFDTKYCRVGGASVSYVSSGKRAAPVIVFIPGWGGSIAFWKSQIDHFSKTHHVIAIDYPGFGLSTIDYAQSAFQRFCASVTLQDRSIAMSRQAKLIINVLRRERIKSCVIVGHSIGGALALTVAAQAPNIVRSVIGADSFTYTALYPSVPQNDIDAITDGLKKNFKRAVTELVDSYFLEDADPELQHWVTETMVASRPESSISILEEFLRWDLNSYLSIYKGPVAVIASAATYDESAFAPVYGNRVSVETIENAGHFVMLDKPAEFSQKLTEALA